MRKLYIFFGSAYKYKALSEKKEVLMSAFKQVTISQAPFISSVCAVFTSKDSITSHFLPN